MVVLQLFIPIEFSHLKPPPHGTTSQCTIQFAAIVYDLWVDLLFNFIFLLISPSEKINRLNLYLTHTQIYFLKRNDFISDLFSAFFFFFFV